MCCRANLRLFSTQELAESCESRDELRRHGEKVEAMKKRGGVLSRNDRAVVRLVRLLL